MSFTQHRKFDVFVTLYSVCYNPSIVQIYRYLKDGLLVIATNVLTEEQALTSVPFNANLK